MPPVSRSVLLLLLSLASCAPNGRERVGTLLGIQAMRDYQGTVEGFVDTYYHARFVADPVEVERAIQRLGLRRYRDAEADSALADAVTGPLGAPGPPPPPDWWRPDIDLEGGALFFGEWSSPGRIDSTYAIGTDPATGLTYVVIGYP